MKRKVASKIMKLWKSNITKLIIYSLAVLILLWISKKTNNESISLIEKVKQIILKEETMSFFLAGLFTLIVAYAVRTIGIRSEENLKIEADHHKIISMYNKHSKEPISREDNFYNRKGNFMRIHNIKKYNSKKQLEKEVVDSKKQKADITSYVENQTLLLPTVNVFTNIKGNVELSIKDTLTQREIPNFVVDNGLKFLMAHKYSNKSNNITIGLNNIEYENNKLELFTSRTTYFHMLLTNRCMDYKLDELVSIRDLYEFNNSISDLKESKMSNQIGINGVIITSDGYLLLEKRNRKKTTWKNKFAQPISLALKESDLKLNDDRLMKDDIEYANKKFMSIIEKTIKSNFGLTKDDYEILDVKHNFLGIARDLLEGGKPNMYFVVTLKDNAKELKEKLENNAKRVGENEIKKEKLLSQYYLVPHNKIVIDYNYILEINKNDIYRVNRIVSPRFKKIVEKFDRFGYALSKKFKKSLKRECGEALLVNLSYLEICKERLNVLKGEN